MPQGSEALWRTWDGYRRRFITGDGRVLRPRDGNDTVSEGQAYALLRAVWMDDQATFDAVYGWTQAHLSRRAARGDHLLAWHWGRQPDGGWGVMDWAAAADADEDYALALLFAARRWRRPSGPVPGYRETARAVLTDLLQHETQRGPDRRLYLLPGDWRADPPVLNPSYFAPAWYRIFAEASGDPRWHELVESSYAAVDRLAQRLGSRTGVGLMPDWAALEADGSFAAARELSDVHGWDAVRTPWRLALDWLWYREPRARAYLADRFLPFLQAEWARTAGRLSTVYTYEGVPVGGGQSTIMDAACLAACVAANSPLGPILLGRIRDAVRQDPAGAYFDLADDYYLNNWAWFGLLLGEGQARNLWG